LVGSGSGRLEPDLDLRLLKLTYLLPFFVLKSFMNIKKIHVLYHLFNK
jgi:hypothetical protein